MYVLIAEISLLQVTRAAVLAVAADALTAAQQSLFLLEQRLLWLVQTEVMNARQQVLQASRFPADPPCFWWWPPSHCHSWHWRLSGDNTRKQADHWRLYCHIQYVLQQVLVLFPDWTMNVLETCQKWLTLWYGWTGSECSAASCSSPKEGSVPSLNQLSYLWKEENVVGFFFLDFGKHFEEHASLLDSENH